MESCPFSLKHIYGVRYSICTTRNTVTLVAIRVWLKWKKIQPFILKLGDSGNGHTNNNDTNLNLKSYYRYMNIDRWLKYMNWFSTVYVASSTNNQILFFDECSRHFDDLSLNFMYEKNIRPFILKLGDSGNGHTNNNDPNLKLKSYYNTNRASWMLEYWTTKFLPHNMNSILMESSD